MKNNAMSNIAHGTKVRRINLSRKTAPCPRCGTISKRHSIGKRHLHEAGISAPTILEVTYSKHYCLMCRKHFSLPMDHLARKGGQYTNRVRRYSIDLVVRQSMTLEKATQRMRQKYFTYIPPSTLDGWIKEEEKERHG